MYNSTEPHTDLHSEVSCVFQLKDRSLIYAETLISTWKCFCDMSGQIKTVLTPLWHLNFLDMSQ